MFALSRPVCWRPVFCRANATLQVASEIPSTTSAFSATSTKAPPSEKESTGLEASSQSIQRSGRKRRRKISIRRANISLENPRPWNRPIGVGVLPAYDEALKYIIEDSKAINAEMVETSQLIKSLKDRRDVDSHTEVEEMQERLEVLAIQSEINLPSVRWKFANAMGDMSKPVYQRLAEQKWRNQGGLDLLMERIHQMHVVPDLLSSLHPSFDLRIAFPRLTRKNAAPHDAVRKYSAIEPGVFLLPEQTQEPPNLYATIFHPEKRYYTMVLVDPDVPDPERYTFTTYLHWLIPNIPLSSTTTTIPLPTSPYTEYIPPHPQRGTPYHRYSLFFLPHPDPLMELTIPRIPDKERLGFNLKQFCGTYGFDPAQGGAAHMWREVWDENVTVIYRDVLRKPEPVYGKPKKPDPFVEVKELRKRYIIN